MSDRRGSGDAIAPVISDLRDGRIKLIRDPEHPRSDAPDHLAARISNPTVVDVSAIYWDLMDRPRQVGLYEDHQTIVSPWGETAYAYRNRHGNVVVMHCLQETWAEYRGPTWQPAEPIDWNREVGWVQEVSVWLGGTSYAREGGATPTSGPAFAWVHALGHHGEPLDLRWINLLPSYFKLEEWSIGQLVLLGSLNFLNCRNVELVEPHRPRSERRRIARTGVTISEIAVRPTGSTTRARVVGTSEGSATPLTSVRGHFSHYGDCCPGQHEPRGKLFGRLEGRYWIPQHARGDREHGERESRYRLEPEKGADDA